MDLRHKSFIYCVEIKVQRTHSSYLSNKICYYYRNMKFTRQHKIGLVESSNLFIVTVVPDNTIHHKVYDCQNYKNTSNCLDVLRLEIYAAASSPFCCAGLVGL